MSVTDPAARPRLLLVEDHADTVAALNWLLTRAGYEVTTAQTAAAALEAASLHPFDVVASDIGLPDMSGYELMKELRARYNLKGIALSGYGSPEDRARATEAGFEGHIVKPVNIGELKAVLRQMLS